MSHAWKYTSQEYTKDLMVRHMCSDHHRDKLNNRLSHDFITKIQSQDNPSYDYYNKMKGLYSDRLAMGYNQNQILRKKQQCEKEETRRDYKDNVNGLILSLEKEEDKRDQFIRQCLRKQQIRAKYFVDFNTHKNQQADKLINQNTSSPRLMANSQSMYDQQLCKENANTWNYNSSTSKYQHDRNIQELELRKTADYTTINKDEEQRARNKLKSNKLSNLEEITEYNSSSNFKRNHKRVRTQGEIENQTQVSKYTLKIKQDLMALNNKNAQNIKSRRVFKIHNPITNPIEYHIQNPYFIQKMQDKYNN